MIINNHKNSGEWARLQCFPDKFEIVLSDAQAYKQFKYSVTVPAIQETVKQMLSLLGIKK
jgi:DNA (cytosine-5)-methyltransferase 1